MDEKDVVSPSLIEGAIKYHGQPLWDALKADQPELWPKLNPELANDLKPSVRRPAEEKNSEFRHKLMTFISRKADMIFKPVRDVDELTTSRDALEEEEETACCGRMPPLETWLESDINERKKRFVDGLQVGDILYCSVQSIQENCLILLLLCTSDTHPVWIEDLQMIGFCGSLPRQHQKEMKLGDFSPKDLVKVKYMSALLDGTLRLLVTMSELVAPGAVSNKLGPIADDELPCHYRLALESKGYDYDRVLHSLPEFKNPGNVRVLSRALLVSSAAGNDEGSGAGTGFKEAKESSARRRGHASFMRGLNGVIYPAKEMAFALAKAQYSRWALESVSKGVEEFKAGKTTEAMLSLNRALQIDPENVEGLVARGVCQASNNFLRKAIADFETALKINPVHNNAKKYLSETLMAYGAALTDKGELDAAKEVYTKVIQLKPKENGGGGGSGGGGGDDARDRIDRIEREERRDGAATSGDASRRKSLPADSIGVGMRSDMSPRRRDGLSPRRRKRRSHEEEEDDAGVDYGPSIPKDDGDNGEGGGAKSADDFKDSKDESLTPRREEMKRYSKYDLVGDSPEIIQVTLTRNATSKSPSESERKKSDSSPTMKTTKKSTPPKQYRDSENDGHSQGKARRSRSRGRWSSKSKSRSNSRSRSRSPRGRKSRSRSGSRSRDSRKKSRSKSRDRRSRSKSRGRRSCSRSKRRSQSRGRSRSKSRGRRSKSRSKSRSRRSKSGSRSRQRRNKRSISRSRRGREDKKDSRSRSRGRKTTRSRSRGKKASRSRSRVRRTSRSRSGGRKASRSRSQGRRNSRSRSGRGRKSRSRSAEKDERSRMRSQNDSKETRNKSPASSSRDKTRPEKEKEKRNGTEQPASAGKEQQQQHSSDCDCWKCFEKKNGVSTEELNKLKQLSSSSSTSLTTPTTLSGGKADAVAASKVAASTSSTSRVGDENRRRNESVSSLTTTMKKIDSKADDSDHVWVEKKPDYKKRSASSSSSSSSSSANRRRRKSGGGGKSESKRKKSSPDGKGRDRRRSDVRVEKNGQDAVGRRESGGGGGFSSLKTPNKTNANKSVEKKSNKALAEMESFLQTLKDNKKKGITGGTAEKNGEANGGPKIKRTFKS